MPAFADPRNNQLASAVQNQFDGSIQIRSQALRGRQNRLRLDLHRCPSREDERIFTLRSAHTRNVARASAAPYNRLLLIALVTRAYWQRTLDRYLPSQFAHDVFSTSDA